MSKNYPITEVSLPALDLMGVFVTTDMNKGGEDAPKLWGDTFMPLAGPVFEKAPAGIKTYGLSLLTGPESFDYWAAMPVISAMPEGFHPVTLPAGTYLKCEIGKLAEIGPGFEALWNKAQEMKREPDLARPSFEEYPAEFMDDGTLFLYMPVK